MSNLDLASLAAIGRTDVLPKHTLCPLRVQDFGELQRQFEACCLRGAAQAGEGLSKDLAERIMDRALVLINIGFFRYGGAGFDGQALSIDQLPVMLWATLRAKHPRITVAMAGLLINDENRLKVRDACLELAGYEAKKKESMPAQPIGQASSEPSENADLPSDKSTI